MGLILDTSILIESERRGEGVEDILRSVRGAHGETDVALSAVSAVELTTASTAPGPTPTATGGASSWRASSMT